MKTILHKSNSRGHANHGWLDTHHTFSFAQYHDAERMHFGALRVLNDDVVEGGMGFGRHPHENMEIISIPLSGSLEHKDSMGNTGIIRKNDVQVMSAGTGVQHSEYNKDKGQKASFLQIWIFPKERDIMPRYGQQTFDPSKRVNQFQQIVGPMGNTTGVGINQEAWLHLASFESGHRGEYAVKQKGNGTYVFVMEGEVAIQQQDLNKRDGLGIWEADGFSILAKSKSEILLIEVPMDY
ncbi:MAG: pirin family protein [Cyclobacteriaceae bacterium]|nr:pirin family protein [Cyclobacteriaceae bacterium]